MVRFVHTADFQIGKPFIWASDRAQTKLQEAREEAIGRVGDVTREQEADFVLIAGDFFDDNTVADDVVTRSCERLSEIEVPVYILPGNHDFAGGPSCVYRRDLFQELKPDHVTVLTEPEPVLVGGEDAGEAEAVILPAPVQRRAERGDPTSHIDSEFGPDADDLVRIGFAHGGVEAFGAGDAASRIDPERAEKANLDYLALGDWHGCKQVGNCTWYSGTPEPDSFKQNDPGNVLAVAIEAPGDEPDVQKISTGAHTWYRKEARLQSEEDLQSLERWFEDIEDPLSAMVRLELEGSLGLDSMSTLEALKKRLEDKVLDVRHRGEVRPKASEEEIRSIGSGGYVTDTVEELQALSETGGDEAEAAERALQLLYQFHQN